MACFVDGTQVVSANPSHMEALLAVLTDKLINVTHTEVGVGVALESVFPTIASHFATHVVGHYLRLSQLLFVGHIICEGEGRFLPFEVTVDSLVSITDVNVEFVLQTEVKDNRLQIPFDVLHHPLGWVEDGDGDGGKQTEQRLTVERERGHQPQFFRDAVVTAKHGVDIFPTGYQTLTTGLLTDVVKIGCELLRLVGNDRVHQ